MLYTLFGILVFIPHTFAFLLPDPYTRFQKLYLPPGTFGPDSVALDPYNQGPYAAVSDGRILKYNGSEFEDFAYLSPNRSKQLCDGVTDLSLGPKCGRPFGVSVDPITGYLYVVGAFGGLYRVSPQGGQATLLANNANGVPFHFLTGIDFDIYRGAVYFTDSSLVRNFTEVSLGIPAPPGDSSGRLIEYNINTGLVRVLLSNLTRPTGPAVSADGTFIAFGLASANKVFKYILVGANAGTTQVLVDNLPDHPVKTKRAPEFGFFWVAVNVIIQRVPRVDKAFGYKINSNGEIILIKDFSPEYGTSQVDVVQEYNNLLQLGGTLYVGSRSSSVNYVGVYRKW